MDIYRQDLIDHYKNPRNYGKNVDADVIMELENISCGDKITLYLEIKDDKVKSIKFEGEGCAVAIASTSKLTETYVGKSVSEILDLNAEKFLQDQNITVTISRIKCATLGFETLKKALKSVDPK
jgi:nitrogen fixation protein NifU and related proteins